MGHLVWTTFLKTLLSLHQCQNIITGRVLTRAQKMSFTPQSLLETPWMPVLLSRQPLECSRLWTFVRMLPPCCVPCPPVALQACGSPRWATAWSGVRRRTSAGLINVEITKCVPWSFAALSGNGLLACCTSTDLEILQSLGWLQKEKFTSVWGREELKRAISWRPQRPCRVCVLPGCLAGGDAGACVVYCGDDVCFSKDRGLAETFLPTFFISQKSSCYPWEGVGGSYTERSELLIPPGWVLYLHHLSIQLVPGPQ